MSPAGGRWFRLNTTWSQSEWIADLFPAARLAWVELLAHVKAHGFDGRLKSVTRYTVSRMYNIPLDDVSAMWDAAVKHGALLEEEGEIQIAKWGDYQGDPKGAERVRRHREKKDGKQTGPSVTGVTRYDRYVTPTETETETSPPLSISLSPPTSAAADAAKKRRLLPLPTDWQPNEAHARLAQERGIDLVLEVDKMRDWATANDERKASWDATFRNWIRNAKPAAAVTANGKGPHLPPVIFDD